VLPITPAAQPQGSAARSFGQDHQRLWPAGSSQGQNIRALTRKKVIIESLKKFRDRFDNFRSMTRPGKAALLQSPKKGSAEYRVSAFHAVKH